MSCSPPGHHYGHAACLAQWVEACQSRNQEPQLMESDAGRRQDDVWQASKAAILSRIAHVAWF